MILNPLFSKSFLQQTTLSSSGWRRLFHSRNPLNPNKLNKNIDDNIVFFLFTAFNTISNFFKQNYQTKNTTIIISRDSRPTGPATINVLKFVLKSNCINFIDLGVTSIPECVTIVKSKAEFKGFIYITASHNPPGYNGIKIGNSTGRIISAKTNALLVKRFKEAFLNKKSETVSRVFKELKKSNSTIYDKKFIPNKFDYTHLYHHAILKNLGYKDHITNIFFNKMVNEIKENNYTVACDFNGSARINSIDQDLITSLGFDFLSIGNKVGKFHHDIIPEGKSLTCLKEKVIEWSHNNKIIFGYAVDCDGDRGNLVIGLQSKLKQNNVAHKVIIPDAQTTFAFSVLAELCYIGVFFPKLLSKTVIVVNGPTSLRIDRLAEIFKVKVVRAEVGEVNVITLANKIRKNGFWVPIIGEGSNGGSIIYPSTIRDPLSTVTSLIKLLFLKNNNISLREYAVKKLGALSSLNQVKAHLFLGALLPYLNTFTSTSVFEDNALLKTSFSNQKNFKLIYCNLFEQYWNHNPSVFKKMTINSYQFTRYEQTKTILGNLKKYKFDGGFKVRFFNIHKHEIGFVWFRFSKTEPVLRLSAEHYNHKHQINLFKIHRKILLEVSSIDNVIE